MFASIKRLVKHSAVYTLGSLLRKSLSFVLLPLITRFMPASEYGLYSLLMAFNGFLAEIYTFGLGGAATRLFFDFSDRESRKKYIGTVWLFSLGSTLLLSILLTLFGKPLFARFLKEVPFWPHLALIIWTTFIGEFALLPHVLLRVEEKSWQFMAVVVGNALLNAVFAVVLVVHFRLGALGLVVAFFGTAVVMAVVYAFILRRYVDLHLRTFPVRSWLKASLVYGAPIVVLELGWILLESSDRFLLQYFLTLKVVGYYSLAYALSKVINYITDSINLAWTPFFYKTASEEPHEAPRVFAYAATYYALLLAVLGLLIIVLRDQFVALLAPSEYWPAVSVTPIIVLASILRGLYNIPARGLYQEKRTYVFPLIVFGGAGLNVLLNVLTIPRYGMFGAAWSTAISYGFMLVVTLVLSQRAYPIPYETARLGKLAAVSLGVLAVAETVLAQHTAVAAILRATLVLAIPLFLFVSGFYEPRELELLRVVVSRRAAGFVGRAS